MNVDQLMERCQRDHSSARSSGQNAERLAEEEEEAEAPWSGMDGTTRMNVCQRVLIICILILLPGTGRELTSTANAAPSKSKWTRTIVKEKPIDLSLPRMVLKHGRFFVVLDPAGMISGDGKAGYGLYADDTRFLSEWDVRFNNDSLVLLNADVSESFAGHFLYGNKPSKNLPEQSIMLQRDIVLCDGMTERWILRNFNNFSAHVTMHLKVGCDFKDMFQVRGWKRAVSGKILNRRFSSTGAIFTYEGVDRKQMGTTVRIGGAQSSGAEDQESFVVTLPPRGSQAIEFSVLPRIAGRFTLNHTSYRMQLEKATSAFRTWLGEAATISSDNASLNRIVSTSLRDLYMLRQETPGGTCIAAGLPWYGVAFGRDQCITALQTLRIVPSLSKEVIQVLASYQGKKHDAFTEEEPGKIMHELRTGEMARAREIPFIPYYGTVDATPLWLLLIGQYLDATGDKVTVEKLWANICAALDFLDRSAGDGYLAYGGRGALSNQGWKDSQDSISYHDGKLARAPIKLCEVQGYLYAAWIASARVASKLGHNDISEKLIQKAQALKVRFNKDFWMPGQHYVPIAIDGDGKQCDVVSSNAGHLLSTGILESDHALEIADRIMQPDMFSGWGIRTLSEKEARYNPMSYHNGSVWPHDNAMIAAGFASLGQTGKTNAVLSALLSVAEKQPDMRLPELFCGFSPKQFEDPVHYPVSCTPQAWAAGSVIQMVGACLDLRGAEGSSPPVLSNVLPSAKRSSPPVPGANALPAASGQLRIGGFLYSGHKYDIEVKEIDGAVKSAVTPHLQ